MRYLLLIFSFLCIVSCSREEAELSVGPEPELCYIDCTFHYISQEPSFNYSDCDSLGFGFNVNWVDKSDGYVQILFDLPDGYKLIDASNILVRKGSYKDHELIELPDHFRKFVWEKEVLIQTSFGEYEENVLEDGFSMTVTLSYPCDHGPDDGVLTSLSGDKKKGCDYECRKYYPPSYYSECMENCKGRVDVNIRD